MKQSSQLLCIVALFVLPSVALGVATPKTHGDKNLRAHGDVPALRGGHQPLGVHQHHIVALQAAHSTHRHTAHRHKEVHKTSACKNKLKWWIKVKRKCVKAYGKDSKWDREKMNGQCAAAWSSCNTGFYAVCCSQPVGPKNIDAYCAGQNLTIIAADDPDKAAKNAKVAADKACSVNLKMRGIATLMTGIKDQIGMMETAAPAYMGPGPGPGPGPSPMPAVILPPPGLVAASPAPAPIVFGPSLPTVLESRCSQLTELTRQAAERIKAVKMWAQDDGIHDDDADTSKVGLEARVGKEVKDSNMASPVAKDPDLVFTVKGVMSVGDKLDAMLKNADFCSKSPQEDEDDDDDAEEDLAKDPTTIEDEEEEEDDEEEEHVTQVNYTAIMELLNWESDMVNAVGKFEKDVHPHGYKWWRYRYEYTMVESFVLAFSVMVMFLTMWLLHGVSFFQLHKFYKTGVTDRLHRYAWAYLVFHAASLMIMVTTAYMLYIPWGSSNVFNWFAQAVHDFVGDSANVPFLGYSWLYMVLDVQFQLFVTFSLYSLFVLFVVVNYQKALEDWKAMSEQSTEDGVKPVNAKLYKTLEGIMKRRVQNTPEYRQIFHELKLRLPGVEGLDKTAPGWNDFKLHLYLTDGLGKSVEYLVEVSLTTNIFLACSALVVALLSYHFEVAFMYFLPGFLVVGMVLFIAGFLVAHHFRQLSENDDHNTPAKYVTVHSYCRAVQIMLYCLFFSFSRLLLSNDIFEFYPVVYVSSCVGLVVVLAMLCIFSGEVIKETSSALILPPHISQELLRKNLEQIVYWHTTEKCHECGAQQFPTHSSLSREWAGKKPIGDRQNPPDSARPYSFRG